MHACNFTTKHILVSLLMSKPIFVGSLHVFAGYVVAFQLMKRKQKRYWMIGWFVSVSQINITCTMFLLQPSSSADNWICLPLITAIFCLSLSPITVNYLHICTYYTHQFRQETSRSRKFPRCWSFANRWSSWMASVYNRSNSLVNL